jgi:hypothetical protein
VGSMAEYLRTGATSSVELVESALATANSFDQEDPFDQGLGVPISRFDDQSRSWAAYAARQADGDDRALPVVPMEVLAYSAVTEVVTPIVLTRGAR